MRSFRPALPTRPASGPGGMRDTPSSPTADVAVGDLCRGNPEAATRLTARQRTLAQEARAARATGDTAAVRILGSTIVERVLASVTADLAVRKAHIERAGDGTPRVEAIVERAERLQRAAAESLRAGRRAVALDLVTQDFDLLARLRR